MLTTAATFAGNKPPSSRTFVLVHGSWQGPYAWQTVKGLLEKKGYKVTIVELPGHGSDNTPPHTLTLDTYRDKVVSAINALPGKVILVGHSMAGMVVSVTAEKVPIRIEKVIYIGAYLPANGQSLLDLANTDADALLGPALIPSADKTLLDIKPENLSPIFIQDGSDAAKKLVVDNYRAEPAIPFTNPAVLSPANFGSVPKYYIHTLLPKYYIHTLPS
ncbi:alpha/beta hydrolase [Spirosoma pollinicola]|uniref:Alpha/beta hydrolase n=2 Tax=Spirosoma pollinicola TaxID=2057025 RepID=A0A2K8ZCK0_9BACT|nr:alpha/beta hydrolase [Spirosoma pollinicola]